jgi:hypothetical protein
MPRQARAESGTRTDTHSPLLSFAEPDRPSTKHGPLHQRALRHTILLNWIVHSYWRRLRAAHRRGAPLTLARWLLMDLSDTALCEADAKAATCVCSASPGRWRLSDRCAATERDCESGANHRDEHRRRVRDRAFMIDPSTKLSSCAAERRTRRGNAPESAPETPS